MLLLTVRSLVIASSPSLFGSKRREGTKVFTGINLVGDNSACIR